MEEQLLYCLSLQQYLMKKELFLLLAFCSWVWPAAGQSCPTFQDPKELMQTGTIEATNGFLGKNAQASRQHVYTVPIIFTVIADRFQGGASFSDFQSSLNSLDFMIYVSLSKNPSQADIILLINEDDSWVKMKITYILHSRTDFYITNYLLTDFAKSWRNRPAERSFFVPYPSNWTAHPKVTAGLAMVGGLNGLRASQKIVEMRTTESIWVQSGLYFNVYIESSSQIEYLSYRVIFFQQPSSFFKYTYRPTTPNAYIFATPQQISNNQINYVYSGFDFSRVNCIGSRCNSTCISQADCKSNNGILSSQGCCLCGRDQTYRNDQCESKIYCGVNQIHNGYNCTCANYHLNVSGTCEPACGLNAYLKDGICTCLLATALCSKLKNCGNNQILVGYNCQCAIGYLLVEGQCQPTFTCPTNSVWNSATANCQPCGSSMMKCGSIECPPSSSWNGSACVCAEELYMSGGACVACPTGSMWLGGECICMMVTQYFSNGQCLSCPAKTRWNGKSCA